MSGGISRMNVLCTHGTLHLSFTCLLIGKKGFAHFLEAFSPLHSPFFCMACKGSKKHSEEYKYFTKCLVELFSVLCIKLVTEPWVYFFGRSSAVSSLVLSGKRHD